MKEFKHSIHETSVLDIVVFIKLTNLYTLHAYITKFIQYMSLKSLKIGFCSSGESLGDAGGGLCVVHRRFT